MLASAMRQPTADELSLTVVARYLAKRGFSEAHAALLAAGPVGDHAAPDLDWLVSSWQAGERANELARAELADESIALTVRCTAKLPSAVTTTLSTIHAGNILVVQPYRLVRRIFDTALADYREDTIDCILTAATDRTLKLTSLATFEVEEIFEPVQSPMIAIAVDPTSPRYVYSAAMDGSIAVTDAYERVTVAKLRPHTKHVVGLAASASGRFVASASADGTVVVFVRSAPGRIEAAVTIKLASPPSALVFLPDESQLIVSRRLSCHLHAYDLPAAGAPMPDDLNLTRFNLNANEDSHVSFSPVALSIHPLGRHLALQTDTSLARIMLVPLPLRPASVAAPLVLYTQAEQGDYSTPRALTRRCRR